MSLIIILVFFLLFVVSTFMFRFLSRSQHFMYGEVTVQTAPWHMASAVANHLLKDRSFPLNVL